MAVYVPSRPVRLEPVRWRLVEPEWDVCAVRAWPRAVTGCARGEAPWPDGAGLRGALSWAARVVDAHSGEPLGARDKPRRDRLDVVYADLSNAVERGDISVLGGASDTAENRRRAMRSVAGRRSIGGSGGRVSARPIGTSGGRRPGGAMLGAGAEQPAQRSCSSRDGARRRCGRRLRIRTVPPGEQCINSVQNGWMSRAGRRASRVRVIRPHPLITMVRPVPARPERPDRMCR